MLLRSKHLLLLIMFSITPVVLWFLLEEDVSPDKEDLMLLHFKIKLLHDQLSVVASHIQDMKPRITKVEEMAKQIIVDNIKTMKQKIDLYYACRDKQEANKTITKKATEKRLVVDDTKINAVDNGKLGQDSDSQKQQALPGWIETFKAPHWSEFKPWRGVFVIFVTYRHAYLKACLDSMANASANIVSDSVCVFALDRPLTERQTAGVNQTMEIIRNVTFCKVIVWELDSDQGREPDENRARRLKHHWWFVLETVFNATRKGDMFDGLLRGYTDDILFIEEDAVFSPDFVQVMWFLSGIKRLNAAIIQTALGGWSGENMINAHPDTMIVRTARTLRGIAYGLNQSTWTYFKSLEKDFFEDKQHDWCESMGLVLGKHNNMTAFRIVVPTLSRIWHVGKWGLGLGGDFEWERPVTTQPNWAFASRLLELKSARVNLGLRDILGFLCEHKESFWYLENVICDDSTTRWGGLERNRILCAKQPYVKDPCDVYV